MIKILFVCVHNSARSQIAETLMNDLGQGKFVAESAGLEPGTLNDDVIDSMAELGYDISNNATKSVFDFYKEGRRYHYVIKVCDQINGQKCPIFPATKAQIDWNHEDPSAFLGSKAERLDQVRVIREDIKKNIMAFIEYHQLKDFDFSRAASIKDKQSLLNDAKHSLSIDHLVVKYNEKEFVGASTSLFKQKERIQHGQSVVAATNLILFDYAESIKREYNVEYLTSNQVLGLMDQLWDILYPVKQGKISLQAFIQGLESFESIKHINYSINYRTIEPNTSSKYRESVIEYITQALSKKRPVAYLSQTLSDNTSNQWSWVIVFKIEDSGKKVSVIDNGSVHVIDLTDWFNQKDAIGGFVHL